MQIGINEKRMIFRIAVVLVALKSISFTSELTSKLMDFALGPITIGTIMGVITLIFVWGNYKRWW